MKLKQGEVWWANLRDPLGWRPVLILTRDDAIPKLHWVTVAPGTIRGLNSEVELTPKDDGVPQPCVVTLDNVATVDQGLLLQRITILSTERMNEVWETLHFAFDLPF